MVVILSPHVNDLPLQCAVNKHRLVICENSQVDALAGRFNLTHLNIVRILVGIKTSQERRTRVLIP